MKVADLTAVVAVLAAAGGAIQTASAEGSEWYLGVGAGQSQSKLDDERLAREMSALGFTPQALSWDHHGDAFKAFAGYKFSRYIGFEASYFNLGRFRFSAPTLPSGSIGGQLKVDGFGLDAVGFLPVTDRLSAFAKIGGSIAETRDAFGAAAGNTIDNPNPSTWRTNPKVGAGMQYAVARHFALRGEWERYRIADGVRDHGNVDAWFLSLVFPFGQPTPAPVAVEAAPAPAPAPVVAVPPPPPPPVAAPPPRRVSFSADALFAFNSAAVRPEGLRDLDKFAGELSNTTFERIHVLGYTDRIGSDSYNLRLSQQRADAVKAHLIDVGRLPAGKIDAEGRGKADPVTKPAECGAKRSAATIRCLQPDRRVVIEVNGTQQP